ncbi:MAG: AAA family ATPase [Mycobacterium sp.]
MTTPEGMATVIAARLHPAVFEDPVSRLMFEFMTEHWESKQAVPTPLVMETEYPSVPLPHADDIDETAQWCVEWLQKRHSRNRVQDVIRRGAEKMEDADVALRFLRDESAAVLEQAGRGPGNDGMPRLWSAADLTPATRPRWLARNRLPRAAVSLLVGDEGIGKSLFWVYLAAPITTGKPLVEFGIPAREPGHVVVVVTEDDWSTTVRPRLEVAGADLAMVHVICTEEDGSGAPEFPRDLHLITEADPAPVLVVVDAWLDTVPARLDVRNPQQARQALHPWREVAITTDAAVLLLTHTNRVNSANARDKYGATGELRKKARMTLFAQRDDDGNLVIGPDKANTAAAVMASRFSVTGVQHFSPTEDHDGTVPRLAYAGETDQTAQQHIADAFASGRGTDGNDDETVIGWLASYLANGPRWSGDLYGAAEVEGFSVDQAKRAKKRLRAKSVKDGATGTWFTRLPGHEGTPESDQESARESE